MSGEDALEQGLKSAHALAAECRAVGEAAWARQPGGKQGTVRRLRALVEGLRRGGPSPALEELESLVRAIEQLASESCTCFEPDSFRDDFERTVVGHDRRGPQTLAEVSLDRCRRCARVWLHYFMEDPEVAESSRWYRAPVPDAIAAGLTASRAAAFLESAPWRLQGGAFHGRRGRRVGGPAALE
jgi:hypothetical protein